MEDRLLDIIEGIMLETPDVGTDLKILGDVTADEFDQNNNVYSFKVTGGRNGTGIWSNYIKTLMELFDRLEAEFQDTFVTDFEIDSLDDVFTVTIAVVPYTGQLD